MAATSNQETNWKEARMAGAEKITDYWDITKAYAGRLAEIILFVCMCAQIIGVLPGVHYPGWIDNVILGVQVIMLDMGGFALNTLADHARDNGQEAAAKKAERMGNFLIGLVIITLALIAVGQLASVAQQYAGLVKNIASDLETVLILVRVISTVKYIHVIHSLRASALDVQSTLSPTQVANVETRLNAQVAQMQEAWTTTSSQLIATVKQDVSSQVANEVANVQTVISEQIARISSPQITHDDTLSEQVTALVQLLNDQARTIQNLTAFLSEVRREVRTTVTEIRSISHDSATIPQLTGPTIDAVMEPGARVRAFLSVWNGSKPPTLQLIMDSCQVAKRTATKYRDEYYGLATNSQAEEEE